MARNSAVQIFELETFVRNILSIYKKTATEKSVAFEIKNDLASHVMLHGEADKITSLLHAVLHNTLNFSGATAISFSTRQLLKSDKEILLEFQLRDNGKTGKGVRRFGYYRTLVYAKQLIGELHGRSELSASHSGTTLKFILKFDWKKMPSTHQPSAISFCTKGLKGKQVLVVEDNEINQKAITQILQKEGVGFKVASNGKEGIDLLERMSQCDLVIMDLEMPYMDGYDAANYIRKKLKKDIPIIGMTSSDAGDAVRCLEAGMNQFIKKPFTPSQLLLQACSFFNREYYTLEPVTIHRQSA